jgi:hypothetical protein
MLRKSLLLSICFVALSAHFSSPALGNLKCTHPTPITDPRFGVTATVVSEISFNDIGCAIMWRSMQCTMDQMAFDKNAIAHDYNTGQDVPAAQAFFAVGCGLQTPMGFDVAAFERREDADTFAAGKEGCTVLTYQELLQEGLK